MFKNLTAEQKAMYETEWVQNIKYQALYGKQKHSNHDKQFNYQQKYITGVGVEYRTLSNLVILDVDNERRDSLASLKDNHQKLRELFIPNDTSNLYVESTGSLGLHIFLVNDSPDFFSKFKTNRMVKFFKAKEEHGFELDLFIPKGDQDGVVDVVCTHKGGLYQEQTIKLPNLRIKSQLKNKGIDETWVVGKEKKIEKDVSWMYITFQIPLPFTPKKPTIVERKVFEDDSEEIETRTDPKNGILLTPSQMERISICPHFIFSTMKLSEYLEWLLQKEEKFDLKTAMEEFMNNPDNNKDPIQKQPKKIKTKSSNESSEETQEEGNGEYSQAIYDQYVSLILELLKDAEIHNYCGSSIKQEISLLPLFRSIMVFPEQEQQKLIDEIFNVSNLTENAKGNYYKTWEETKKGQVPYNHLGIFFKTIKYNCPEKYQEFKDKIEQLQKDYPLECNLGLEKIKTMKNQIDFTEPLTFEEVFDERKIEEKYLTPEDWFLDVQKVLYWNRDTACFYKKKKMGFGKNIYCLAQISKIDIAENLQQTQIDGVILNDYLYQVRKYICYHRVVLSDPTEDEFPIFRSFPYKPKQNDELIQPYLDHIREIICNKRETLYKYVVDLLAFYIQKPVSQSGVGLVIRGEQGTGKNLFTNPLIQLMGAYGKESNSIDRVVGQFNPVLEGTHLLVCNEMTSCDYQTKKANFDRLKSLLTDPWLDINQKCEHERNIGNMLNFIFLSNQDKPVIVEKSNRRYCVMKTADKREWEYYNRLIELYKKEEFYEALMYFLQTRDISQFEPMQQLPLTDETKLLMGNSQNTMENFIYGLQLSGYSFEVLWHNYQVFMGKCYKNTPQMNIKAFTSEVKNYYDEKRSLTRNRYRSLKQEFRKPEEKLDIKFDVIDPNTWATAICYEKPSDENNKKEQPESQTTTNHEQ